MVVLFLLTEGGINWAFIFPLKKGGRGLFDQSLFQNYHLLRFSKITGIKFVKINSARKSVGIKSY